MSVVAQIIDLLTKDTDVEDKLWEHTYPYVTGSRTRASEPPAFETFPREYLSYAEAELDQGTPASRINCVSHLKRALECQIDIFLNAWCLRDYARKQRMQLHAKLEFLKALGLLNARSVTRLNLIRNKVEHDYAKPSIADLDVYYDLVAALIAGLERATVGADTVEVVVSDGDFNIGYAEAEPRIIATLSKRSDVIGRWREHEKLEISLADDKEHFIQCFRILFLLADADRYIIDQDTLLDRLEQMRPQ